MLLSTLRLSIFYDRCPLACGPDQSQTNPSQKLFLPYNEFSGQHLHFVHIFVLLSVKPLQRWGASMVAVVHRQFHLLLQP